MAKKDRKITDDMLLSELTVGEFKNLLETILSGKQETQLEEASPLEEIKVRRKSLDEFMNDLGEKK